MQKIATLLLPLAVVLPLQAAEDRFDPEARAKTIAPFLDAQTIALAHVDFSRVDVDRLAAIFADTAQLPAEEVMPFKQAAGPWITGFKNAGGRELYLVISAEDLPRHLFSVVVPMEGAANAAQLAPLLRILGMETVEKLERALFAGSKAALARFRGGKPAPRPEVAQAFAAAGDTAAQFLLLPTPDIRRVIEEIIPTLPDEIGDGSSTKITRGFLWAAIGVDGQPKTSLRLVIQSQDAASARSFHTLLDRVYKALSQDRKVRRSVPSADELLSLLLPTIAADRLMLRFDPSEQKMARLLTALAPLATQHVRRDRCVNNLKQIVLALHMYHDAHGKFPPQANRDSGKPLLSWRVHILPQLGEEKLYKEFHLDEPWDSEHNKQLIARMPAVYRCPSMKSSLKNKTTYLGPVHESAMFTGTPEGVPIKDVEDGTSNTIFIVDADDGHAVIWSKPEDLKYDPKNPRAGLIGHHDGVIMTALVDGSVHYLPDSIDNQTLQALFTRKGGEVVAFP
jgi:hypothetical protein